MQQYIGPVVLQDLALQALPDIRREAAGFRQTGSECVDDLLIADAAPFEDRARAAERPPGCSHAAPDFLSLRRGGRHRATRATVSQT